LKKNQWILALVVLAALAALLVWARNRIHFDFHLLATQVAQADWRMIAFGLVCIYAAYLFRAARWSLLMRHQQKVPLLSLVGTQVIGFTAVALIGRVADPVRPYLVSRKTSSPLATQLAVYIVERLLDVGSMALIFSIAMIWVPGDVILHATARSGSMANLAAHNHSAALLVARYSGLFLTLLGALFLVFVRLSGGVVASLAERGFGLISKSLGKAIAHKIRMFHSGLDTIRSWSDFLSVTALSLCMWIIIAMSYLFTCKAFVASSQLAGISISQCVLLMVASGTASIIQLPVLGWFSQIGLVALALTGILHAEAEAATACAAVLLLVTFLGIVPAGLIWAQFEHVSLRKVAHESGQAEDEPDTTVQS
jgi:glycosyltransferase 2 family protein